MIHSGAGPMEMEGGDSRFVAQAEQPAAPVSPSWVLCAARAAAVCLVFAAGASLPEGLAARAPLPGAVANGSVGRRAGRAGVDYFEIFYVGGTYAENVEYNLDCLNRKGEELPFFTDVEILIKNMSCGPDSKVGPEADSNPYLKCSAVPNGAIHKSIWLKRGVNVSAKTTWNKKVLVKWDGRQSAVFKCWLFDHSVGSWVETDRSFAEGMFTVDFPLRSLDLLDEYIRTTGPSWQRAKWKLLKGQAEPFEDRVHSFPNACVNGQTGKLHCGVRPVMSRCQILRELMHGREKQRYIELENRY